METQTNQQTEEQKKAQQEAKKAEKAAQREAEKAEKAAQREAKKAQAAAEREAKKAEKAAQREAKKAEKAAAKVQQPSQNDVTRPKPETSCGKLWALFDSASQQKGAPAAIGDVFKTAQETGFNDATTRTQYARWRKFHGISGRVEKAA